MRGALQALVTVSGHAQYATMNGIIEECRRRRGSARAGRQRQLERKSTRYMLGTVAPHISWYWSGSAGTVSSAVFERRFRRRDLPARLISAVLQLSIARLVGRRAAAAAMHAPHVAPKDGCPFAIARRAAQHPRPSADPLHDSNVLPHALLVALVVHHWSSRSRPPTAAQKSCSDARHNEVVEVRRERNTALMEQLH